MLKNRLPLQNLPARAQMAMRKHDTMVRVGKIIADK